VELVVVRGAANHKAIRWLVCGLAIYDIAGSNGLRHGKMQEFAAGKFFLNLASSRFFPMRNTP